MSEALNQSALAGRSAPEGLAVDLREMTGRGMIDLRGMAGDSALMAAVAELLGVALPTTPRTAVSWGEVKVFWLSTDQWLVLCPLIKLAETLAALEAALTGLHCLVAGVSDMRSVIRVEGDAARQVLLKGTSLDLLSPDYSPGTVRRMLFAGTGALINIVSAGPDVIEIYVFRSYAVYAWDWLIANAGKAAVPPAFGAQAAPAV